ncbi:MAG: ABC transporter ATP-binding protein, partial [Actinomycetes bacterium]
NVLILDEPTNHLDLESRESLEDALRSYEGSLLLVTHDRALLDAVGTRTVAVEQHTLHSYAGGWAEYARLREERGPLPQVESPPTLAENGGAKPAAAEVAVSGEASAPATKATGAKPAVSKNRRREQQKLEQKVADAEQQLAALEDELADPAAWASEYESAKSQARHTAATRAVEAAYEELELFEAGAPAVTADGP